MSHKIETKITFTKSQLHPFLRQVGQSELMARKEHQALQRFEDLFFAQLGPNSPVKFVVKPPLMRARLRYVGKLLLYGRLTRNPRVKRAFEVAGRLWTQGQRR